MIKKILLLVILLSTFLFAQWDGTTNKVIRERDLFDSIFDQALDSSGGGGGANLEPELVVTPASSKIVMNVDSVNIRHDLIVDGDIYSYGGSGDINGNGYITASDVVLIQGYLNETEQLTKFQKARADINGDNRVDWDDYDMLLSLNGCIPGEPTYTALKDSVVRLVMTKTRKESYLDFTVNGNHTVDGNLIVYGYATFNDYTFPPVDGSSGTVMKTDGNGNLYWGSDIYGGGGGGSDTASVLYHLSRYVTADSFATYAEGLARYQPLESTLTDVADGTIVENLVNTTNPWADNEVANDLTIDATNISSSITRDTEVTKELLGTNGDISDGTIVNGDDNTLTTEDDVYDFVTTRGYSDVRDSNFVLTSETSAWDKNSSNDLIYTDTTAVTGKIATKQNLNSYSNTAHHVGVPGYGSIKDFITDGNVNWNNSYGFITGISANYITESMLYAKNSPTDEYVLTYESSGIGTPGDFEWQAANNVTGDTIIATNETLDSLVRDYWNDNLGGGVIPDSVIYTSELNVNNLKEVKDWEPAIANGDAIIFDGGVWKIKNIPDMIADSLADIRSRFQSILDALEGCCDLSDVTPPSAPTSLVATADNDTAKIRLTWTDPTAGDLDSIRIYRAVVADTSAYTYLARVAAGVKAYTNTGLTENTAYWYKLKAVDDSSNISGYSNRDSAKTFTTAGAIPVVESFETDSVLSKSRLAIKKPSGIQTGDLLIVVVANDYETDTPQWSNTTNKPTGFTWIATSAPVGSARTGMNNTQSHVAVFWRVADGTESYDSVIVNSVGTTYEQVGYFLRISGAHTITPIDVSDSPMDSIYYEERDTLQCHSLTTGYDNELAIVVAAFDEAGNGGTEATFTVTGTGWSKLSNNDYGNTPDGIDLIIGTKEVPSAGATGIATVDASLPGGAIGFQFTIRSP